MIELPKPTAIEPVTKAQMQALARALGGAIPAMIARLGDADLSVGRGVLPNGDRCLWTKDGRRITVSASHGTFIAAVTRDLDRHCPIARHTESPKPTATIHLFELHDEDHVECAFVFAESADEAKRRYSTEIVELREDATAEQLDDASEFALSFRDDPINPAVDVPEGGRVVLDGVYNYPCVVATCAQWCAWFVADRTDGATFGILSESE